MNKKEIIVIIYHMLSELDENYELINSNLLIKNGNIVVKSFTVKGVYDFVLNIYNNKPKTVTVG